MYRDISICMLKKNGQENENAKAIGTDKRRERESDRKREIERA